MGECLCTCGDKRQNVLVFACSGASNLGQITNQSALRLMAEGFGKMFCLAGIGGGVESFINSAKLAEEVVALDGCAVGCALATLRRQGIEPTYYLQVSQLNIPRKPEPEVLPEEVEKVVTAVKKAWGEKKDGNLPG